MKKLRRRSRNHTFVNNKVPCQRWSWRNICHTLAAVLFTGLMPQVQTGNCVPPPRIVHGIFGNSTILNSSFEPAGMDAQCGSSCSIKYSCARSTRIPLSCNSWNILDTSTLLQQRIMISERAIRTLAKSNSPGCAGGAPDCRVLRLIGSGSPSFRVNGGASLHTFASGSGRCIAGSCFLCGGMPFEHLLLNLLHFFLVVLALPCLSSLHSLCPRILPSVFFGLFEWFICQHNVAKLVSTSPACPCTSPLVELRRMCQTFAHQVVFSDSVFLGRSSWRTPTSCRRSVSL